MELHIAWVLISGLHQLRNRVELRGSLQEQQVLQG